VIIMVEKDTIKLLRECDAGVKMGIASIEDVVDKVSAESLAEVLRKSKCEHFTISNEIEEKLKKHCDSGKEPCPMVKGMSWVKTNMKLAVDDSDAAIAELMTDGCNMGVKSLSRYLNQYKAADEYSKDIAKKLIAQEEKLAVDMRAYL